ncbi:helix-turn-helix domain-containing protein [Pseudarthrobacter sp. NBSH8]|uniref:helix-turn-helix domain-containing protein n=1 Tax=Pseudarthrobacter sp. NBSH8 TaxID=2596911 RepID=UPI001627F42E|nr:helix-turn-helix domain-containing protein [Pseudarthrobacter sp. NBSH8]QNE14375.1 helix-turn-helix transcriptional regulator [Pseudarthrobacter sp. NBSH8]
MSLNDLVSRNVRRFRAERNLTLGELARRASLSKQTLSKIEQGGGNPTVGTLEAIGEALGLSYRGLLTEWGTKTLVSRAMDAAWVRTLVGEERNLDRIYGSGYVRTQVVTVEQTQRVRLVTAQTLGTLHQLYVIEGRLEAGPENEMLVLSMGDFARFPGDVDHGYRSLGGRAMFHLTTTTPEVPQFTASK